LLTSVGHAVGSTDALVARGFSVVLELQGRLQSRVIGRPSQIWCSCLRFDNTALSSHDCAGACAALVQVLGQCGRANQGAAKDDIGASAHEASSRAKVIPTTQPQCRQTSCVKEEANDTMPPPVNIMQ
jgi:hypothetical protein